MNPPEGAIGTVVGIGTDIVAIQRVRDSLERFGERFARRILTADELLEYRQARGTARFLAKRFAAKEAAVKAMGTGFRDGLAFDQIGVTHDPLGRPGLTYRGRAAQWIAGAGIAASLLSLSDERDYAVAFVILLR
ncbi:MAG: holo-ACP synthase [Candidatus Competibacteraceae bacterium]|nr:holo-ACP synthase [Candidatus Competibacteraceae bacterium]